MIISQTPEEIKAASALQSKCELKRIVLRRCRASREESQAAAPFSLRISHSSIANEVGSGVLRIEARLQVQGHDSSDPTKLVFNVECAFDLDYQIQDQLFQPKPESLAAFKDGNAIFNMWPYAREFVNNLISRMELNTHPLPLLRIVPKKSEPVKQQNTEAVPALAEVEQQKKA
jgi:hypothetical protein